MQVTNQQIKDNITKKNELIIEFTKKISGLDKDFKEALGKERKPLRKGNEILTRAVQAERQKITVLEDSIKLFEHKLEREEKRYLNISKDLKIL